MPLPDCPQCGGTGSVMRGSAHDLSEAPWHEPCPNPLCYTTSTEVWATWAPRYIFQGGAGDPWDDMSEVAAAMRDRFFELRAEERRTRIAARRAEL